MNMHSWIYVTLKARIIQLKDSVIDHRKMSRMQAFRHGRLKQMTALKSIQSGTVLSKKVLSAQNCHVLPHT